ncbi:MAG TPA: DUF4440 domain-containing protein [Gemmatimonadales bacterium]|nr:DUF4440 domain-containing protein [Gemmatimonadales bacterium]
MRMLPAVLLLTVLVGCAGRRARQEEAPRPSRPPARDTLIATDLARGDSVARMGLTRGLLSLMSEDVAFLRAGVPAVYGRAAVESLLSAGGPRSGAVYRWEPLGAGISGDARAGYTYGVAATSLPPDSGAATQTIRMERYIAFWRRAPGGAWRIIAYAEVGGRPVTGLSITEGLAPPGHPVSGRAGAMHQELRRTDSSFSAAASRDGIAAAFAAWAAPAGVVFSGTEIVAGADAIRATFTRTHQGMSLAWMPVHTGVADSGDLGFTIGEYVATGRSRNGAIVQRFGKYLSVWELQPDGRWRYAVDGGSPGATPGSRANGSPNQGIGLRGQGPGEE